MIHRRIVLGIAGAAAAGAMVCVGPRPVAAAVVNNADSLYVPAGQSITLGGPHVYSRLVKVEATGVVYVTKYTGGANTGYLELTAPTMVIAGTLNGDGRGFRGEANYQEGTGCGGYPGGGGGYGGAGGRGGQGGSGGVTYGSSSGGDIEKGSGGGDAPSGQYGGGNGGAYVKLFAHTLQLSGTITLNGTAGYTALGLGAGGGSGGGLIINVPAIVWSGTLSARGGNGENSGVMGGGGGGGGGRIKLYYSSLQQSGSTVLVSGGTGGTGSPAGLAGSAGTYYGQIIPEPTITAIVDVRNDQGRQVRVSWLRAYTDNSGEAQPVTHYTLWRRIDALPRGTRVGPATAPRPLTWPPGAWDFVADVPARGEASYNVVVPTLADSNDGGMHRSVFFVSGVTANPFLYYDSPPDSGYSVDNLAPLVPAPFGASWVPDHTTLSWGASEELDFRHYRLYRGDAETFVPAPGNLVATLTLPGFDDGAPGLHYYKLCAVDRNGNRSAYGLVRPNEISGVPDERRGAFWLGRAVPNPTSAGATIAFRLPQAGPITLVLYDVQGRVTRVLLSGTQPAGESAVRWDGRDAQGRPAPAGLYFYRLEVGARVLTGRLERVR